ncbi:MAG TPA: sigma-70 family RNA polymerase sigma factor [Baekduia sp.]|nr:sigma-70 family RNA polymerase sigma factor [Baekduia sp.]
MPQAVPPPRMLWGDEAQLFADAALRAAVRHLVDNADAAVVEDACSYAWLQRMRTQPERGDTLFAWLRTVAVREAWRLARREPRDGHLELVPDSDERLAGDTLQDTVAAHDALRTLAALPAPQRQCLTLIVGGHSYADVTHLTGRSYSSVNRQLVKARRRLRQRDLDDRS